MTDTCKGSFVMSIAGNDKGEIYVVLSDTENQAYLVNGKNRKVNNPKRKSKKHIVSLNGINMLTEPMVSAKLCELILLSEGELAKSFTDGKIRKAVNRISSLL